MFNMKNVLLYWQLTLLLKLMTMLLKGTFCFGIEWMAHTILHFFQRRLLIDKNTNCKHAYHNVACFKVIKLLKRIQLLWSSVLKCILSWMMSALYFIAFNWHFQFAHKHKCYFVCHVSTVMFILFPIIPKTGWSCVV